MCRGVSSAGSTCSQCRRPFLDSSALTAQPVGSETGEASEGQSEAVMPAGIALFPCTHAFHAPCLGSSRACPLCSKQKRTKVSASVDDLPRQADAARPPQTIQDSIQGMIAGTKGALVRHLLLLLFTSHSHLTCLASPPCTSIAGARQRSERERLYDEGLPRSSRQVQASGIFEGAYPLLRADPDLHQRHPLTQCSLSLSLRVSCVVQLQMLYTLAGKGQQAGGGGRPRADVGPPARPQSLSQPERKGWRGATRLTAQDIEREGFRLSRPHT
jgi:hypothetical protein